MRSACMNTYGTFDLSTIARNLVFYLVFTAETAGERGYYRDKRDCPRVAIACKRVSKRPISVRIGDNPYYQKARTSQLSHVVSQALHNQASTCKVHVNERK